MKTILILIALFFLTNCQSNSTLDNASAPTIINSVEQKEEMIPEPLSEEELKAQLKKKECESPINYLNASFTYFRKYKHVLSSKVNGLELKFKIRNSATIATFKNMKISVKFLAKTGAVVKEEVFSIYEYVEPGELLTHTVEMPMTNQEHNDYDHSTTEVVGADCDLPIININ